MKYSYITFNYIRNKIRTFKRDGLLFNLNQILTDADLKQNKTIPIWEVLLLVKWTYLYAGQKYPSKELTREKFIKLLDNITKLQDIKLKKEVKNNGCDSFFQILSYQQFYLQQTPFWDDFSRQLILYETLSSKYDIGKSFFEKTSLTISEFIELLFLFWLYVDSNKLNKSKEGFFKGYIHLEDLSPFIQVFGKEKVSIFLNILTLDDQNAKQRISDYKKSFKSGELQPFEISVFTLYPFQKIFGKLNVIHSSIYGYTCINYIYDYLKENDDRFTEEFGLRFEKYIELGLKEIKAYYTSEKELKQRFGNRGKVTDFVVDDFLIIECKAIEQKPIAAVNPFNETSYRALKDSIIKAYTKQMLNIASKLNGQQTKYGLIITYKEFYYSSINDLWGIVKEDVKQFCKDHKIQENPLLPQHVFVIDITTWDKMVQIVKNKKASLKTLLEVAVTNNSKEQTKKKWFNQHLDNYKVKRWTLSYLQDHYKKMTKLTGHKP